MGQSTEPYERHLITGSYWFPHKYTDQTCFGSSVKSFLSEQMRTVKFKTETIQYVNILYNGNFASCEMRCFAHSNYKSSYG